jgi:hypothetical protein
MRMHIALAMVALGVGANCSTVANGGGASESPPTQKQCTPKQTDIGAAEAKRLAAIKIKRTTGNAYPVVVADKTSDNCYWLVLSTSEKDGAPVLPYASAVMVTVDGKKVEVMPRW